MNTNDYESIKKQLLNALNEKETENGDKAFNSTLNKYFDIIGQTAYYRENLVELLSFNIDTGEFDKWFSMLVRDGRLGSGERAIGRILLSQTSVTPEEVYNCGRADDLLFIGIEAGRVEFLDYFIKKLLDGDLNCKKWFPREHSSKKEWYKVIMKRINKKFTKYKQRICHHFFLCKEIENEWQCHENRTEISHSEKHQIEQKNGIR